MQIYLPIAELSVNIFLLLGLGGGVGFLSGMFGIGGGFLMTPLLIFIGIPPAVAVASEANQIVGSSVSGVVAHWRRRAVDFKMGTVLVGGGILGAAIGVYVFRLVREMGQIDLLISLSYVIFLSVIGALMLRESISAIRRARQGKSSGRRKPGQHYWVHGMPFRMRFPQSKLYTSSIPPAVLGFVVGLLAAIMGVGGGFIMVPAMIYLLRMPTNVVVGTSLFQIIFITGVATLLHAATNQTVDVLLVLLLLIGSVIGVQFGVRAGQRLKGEELRALLAILVLGVSLRLAFDLFMTPEEMFTVSGILE